MQRKIFRKNARKLYTCCGSQTKRLTGVGSKTFSYTIRYGIIWRPFIRCWHIEPGYKVIRKCSSKVMFFLLVSTFLKTPSKENEKIHSAIGLHFSTAFQWYIEMRSSLKKKFRPPSFAFLHFFWDTLFNWKWT